MDSEWSILRAAHGTHGGDLRIDDKFTNFEPILLIFGQNPPLHSENAHSNHLDISNRLDSAHDPDFLKIDP